MNGAAKYVLIGGGATSASAATSIRKRDEEGRIVIVGAEAHPPYDRPPLSKQFLQSDDWSAQDLHSKKPDFYADSRVELRIGAKATGIDRAEQAVTLEDGETIGYEKLLLATGAVPRRLNLPGGDLQGVFYLRTVGDAEAIRAALQQQKRCVLVGGGYIGMEVASSCVARGVEATIIERDEHPWPAFASPALGNFIREYYEARGVKFAMGEEVSAFVGDGNLTAVQTKGGQAVEADFAVVGIGAVLNTQLAVDAGLEADAQGVRVDSHLQTSDPNIWAAGDIACFEDVALGKQWHVEHFMNAKWQGTAAGTNMAGEAEEFARVPFFFSDILDLHMCLRGDPGAGEETKVLGDLEGGEFVELYHDDSDRLRMGVVVSRDDDWANSVANALNSLVREGADVKTLDAGTFES